jgi:hypothetical protein
MEFVARAVRSDNRIVVPSQRERARTHEHSASAYLAESFVILAIVFASQNGVSISSPIAAQDIGFVTEYLGLSTDA